MILNILTVLLVGCNYAPRSAKSFHLPGTMPRRHIKYRATAAEVDHVQLVLDSIAAQDDVMIAQVAPAVRVSLGEEFGLEPGTVVTGKTVAALRELGFHYVFDVLAGADVTIVEEGTELFRRLRANLVDHTEGVAPLPMFTSCCPGWIDYVETQAPEMIPHVSTAKSPHMIEGALVKAFFSTTLNRTSSELEVVSVMPCVRKQGEADRLPFHTVSGAREVDHVINTRELASMIKAAGIDFMNLPDSGPKSQFDPFMGLSTGASSIFGVTGGVMEAALRTVVELASCTECANGECSTDVLTHTTKIPSTKLIFEEVRGFEGLREATIKIPANPKGPLLNVAPITLRVAIVNGLGNAKKLLKSAPEKYHFVEVMACRGGCIGGGGQPRSKDKSILEKRRDAIYGVGERCELRRSHENPVVKEMYSRWLDKPGSPQAESLLHTNYVAGGPKKYNVTLGQNLQDIEHDMQVEEKDDKK